MDYIYIYFFFEKGRSWLDIFCEPLMRHMKRYSYWGTVSFFSSVAFHRTSNGLLLFLANVQSQIFQSTADTCSHSIHGYRWAFRAVYMRKGLSENISELYLAHRISTPFGPDAEHVDFLRAETTFLHPCPCLWSLECVVAIHKQSWIG